MPKSLPDQIHIRIDTQEQRSGIPDLLAAMPQVHIEVIPLRTGDYDVGGDPRRVFERKTGSDFLSSLAQGRLFAQLIALRKSRFAPILLLEGDPLRVGHSQMRPESIRGALTYITAVLRVPILPSSGPEDSAQLVYAAAKQCQIGHATHGPAVGRRRATLSEQQMQIVLSLPGVGRATARGLRAISQLARPVECRRRPTFDGPRCRALACRCSGTAAARHAAIIWGWRGGRSMSRPHHPRYRRMRYA